MILYYLIGINIISFFMVGLDKYFAIKRKYRIPENTLLLLEILLGWLGLILGFIVFHHKTKKTSFLLKFLIIFIIEFLVIIKLYML